MPIVIPASWNCGKYLIRRICRLDNPGWPGYLIFRNDKLVGRSFSVPDEGWCASIERLSQEAAKRVQEMRPRRFTYRLPR